ncbi:MAG: VCBS repeat-containing protein [Clostridia bacterium]|nr:VCBS repeat-containing protein [Clostridia bacterium]
MKGAIYLALAVAASLSADVTRDGVPDLVALVGERIPGSQYWQNLRLVIQNGATSVIGAIDLPVMQGVSPTLFVGAFTGPDAQNILVSLPTGGSGGIVDYFIFNYENAIIETLFNSETYNSEYQYQVDYVDNYRVAAVSQNNQKSYFIDISQRGDDYLSPIYLPNGVVRQPLQGFVNPLSGLYPIDFDGDGVYALQAWQKIAGLSNADTLGYFLNRLEWIGTQFVLTDQLVGIPGTELTPIQPR